MENKNKQDIAHKWHANVASDNNKTRGIGVVDVILLCQYLTMSYLHKLFREEINTNFGHRTQPRHFSSSLSESRTIIYF